MAYVKSSICFKCGRPIDPSWPNYTVDAQTKKPMHRRCPSDPPPPQWKPSDGNP